MLKINDTLEVAKAVVRNITEGNFNKDWAIIEQERVSSYNAQKFNGAEKAGFDFSDFTEKKTYSKTRQLSYCNKR